MAATAVTALMVRSAVTVAPVALWRRGRCWVGVVRAATQESAGAAVKALPVVTAGGGDGGVGYFDADGGARRAGGQGGRGGTAAVGAAGTAGVARNGGLFSSTTTGGERGLPGRVVTPGPVQELQARRWVRAIRTSWRSTGVDHIGDGAMARTPGMTGKNGGILFGNGGNGAGGASVEEWQPER